MDVQSIYVTSKCLFPPPPLKYYTYSYKQLNHKLLNSQYTAKPVYYLYSIQYLQRLPLSYLQQILGVNPVLQLPPKVYGSKKFTHMDTATTFHTINNMNGHKHRERTAYNSKQITITECCVHIILFPLPVKHNYCCIAKLLVPTLYLIWS